MGSSLSLCGSQSPVKLACHCSDPLPALCFLACLSLPGQPHSGLELLQHKQAHWFPYTNCPRSTVTGLSFRFPSSVFGHLLPSDTSSPPPFPLSPNGKKDLGLMPRAGGRSAFHLEEMLHFSPLTQKNMVLRKLVFSTESSQRKKKGGGGGGAGPEAPHSSLTTSPCPIQLLILGDNCSGAAHRAPAAAAHNKRITLASGKRMCGLRDLDKTLAAFPFLLSHPCFIQLLLPSPGMFSSCS